jgi:hypothetical protein
MALGNVTMHEGYVPAYQISSIPWLTSSNISLGEIHEYDFPSVTKFVLIQNRSTSDTGELCVSFTRNGLNNTTSNYFSVDPGITFREEFRTTKLFISCSSGQSIQYQLIAGMTGIPSNQFLLITGSNGYQNVG